MNKKILEILKRVTRQEPFFATCSGVHGRLLADAALQLQELGLCRFIHLNGREKGVLSYVVIPPNRYWSFTKHDIGDLIP